jgi:starch phosphorylase
MSGEAKAEMLEKLGLLQELARDLRWAGDSRAETLWRRLDPRLWVLTENPWFVLQTVPVARQQELLGDHVFDQQLTALAQMRREDMQGATWFQRHPSAPSLGVVAYFSMEFMLSEALPIYSGGLGNVAGDQLKAASDLGVPVVGVGLLYQQGYFRQVIDKDGNQQALFPYNDPGQMPVTPVRGPDGEPFRLEIALPGYSVWLRAWEAQVGRLKLYLLDSNDVANFPAHRAITGELYGGGTEMRLKQEILLGIGGWRLLAALGIRPDVCHLNEGHAAFAILERARHFMLETGQSFDAALAVTRAGNLFTTHTAVEAGFDRFSSDLIKRYLGRYIQKLGISLSDFLALGRIQRDDASEPFNMAYLAIRGSGAVNAVSRLHGEVSRRLFGPLFSRWPEQEIPIGHVTNGIHVSSWSSTATADLWTRASGADQWKGAEKETKGELQSVSDEELWHLRNANRGALIEFTRQRLSRERAMAGLSPEAVESARQIFDPSILTVVFARRFATYKRPTLLLLDPERLVRLLTDERRPIQFIVAGKAHPADRPGQEMIREWMRFLQRPEVSRRVVFLSDYDMLLTQRLVQGADVWLNTPQRPWEACGTSGMKILANGGLNLSELDGWWAEQSVPEAGWSIGDGNEHSHDPQWDQSEAEAIYQLLENQIVPEFYTRDERGIPAAWMGRVRKSMALLTPEYSADRAVREYTEKYYFPASSAFRHRAAHKGAEGAEIASWRHVLEHNWPTLRFVDFKMQQKAGNYSVEVQVESSGIPPDFIRVEVYADGSANEEAFRLEMDLLPRAASTHTNTYLGVIPADRPAERYTVRVVPRHHGGAVPLEAPLILWQR